MDSAAPERIFLRPSPGVAPLKALKVLPSPCTTLMRLPDQAGGIGWCINIPADVSALAEGAGDAAGAGMPKGAAQGRTDFGTVGFGGACPPAGDKPHRYIFTLHALKVEKIDVPTDASAALTGFMINANRIGKTSFTARYGR